MHCCNKLLESSFECFLSRSDNYQRISIFNSKDLFDFVKCTEYNSVL